MLRPKNSGSAHEHANEEPDVKSVADCFYGAWPS